MNETASSLRYRIHKITRDLRTPEALALAMKSTGTPLTKLYVKLNIAERRELKRLARVLTYKADVYGPTGRIYSFEAPWTVGVDGAGKPALFHGTKQYDPNTLRDGHGQLITDDSKL